MLGNAKDLLAHLLACQPARLDCLSSWQARQARRPRQAKQDKDAQAGKKRDKRKERVFQEIQYSKLFMAILACSKMK